MRIRNSLSKSYRSFWCWAAFFVTCLSMSAFAQNSMSAAQIVAILQQNPELLATAKNTLAQRNSADPSTISDEAVFSRIEQDAALRVRITQQLNQSGYLIDDFGVNTGSSSASPSTKPPTSRRSERSGAADIAGADEASEEPRILHRSNPYPSLPSLEDLYSQYPSTDAKLKRFGMDIFRYGSGNTDNLPMDLPAGPDYVLGPGDGLVVNLWGLPHLEGFNIPQRLPRTVDRQGQVALPDAGSVTVAGKTMAQAQEAIQKTLGAQFQNIRVEISLARVRTVRVYVVGDVQRPGAYDLSSLSTAMNALYAAGGPTSRGSLRLVRHYRSKELIREVDLYDFLLHVVSSDTARLLPGDTILVPPVGPQVAVSGMVRRPAIYELSGEQDLKQVLELAGGVLVSATLRQINVERINAHERHTMLSVQLPDGGNGAGAEKALTAFHIQDGDRVLVAPILPYNEQAIYLEGHVFRPGRYPYHEGITVNDLLRSYQDVMPEPANHAEIIRLQPPDFRPMTINFDLSEVLSGDDPINLQPFDVIRLFSRYEVDPPKVTIRGEALRPGEYPLEHGMTAAALLDMAGGFKRSAYRDLADLASYAVQNGTRILTSHQVIDIGRAESGDKSADVKLKPGDILTIRQLTGWQDIGASVTISGEVCYPGTYGITEGERLSSVLRRVGGFRDTAYPAGAILERVQVRDIGEKARLEMIRRIETTSPSVSAGLQSSQEQAASLQAMEQQRQQILASLRNHPASGRQVIRISGDIKKWERTPADIEMRAGDVLVIPKRPTFVMVGGQVYNATAISFAPGKDASWYLRQTGGPTSVADKKGIFIVRADGSVVSRGESLGVLWKESTLSTRMEPGDSIMVPEKIKGGSMFWKNALSAGQIMSGVGLTAAVVLK
jgi:protein involved in polysaccharide export with SLBB domain